MKANLIKFSLILLLSISCNTILYGQFYEIRGRVYDAEDRRPLPGAGIVVKNLADTLQTVGGASNEDGRFRVSIPGYDSMVIRIRSVGYATFELKVSKRMLPDSLIIFLRVDQELLREVKVEAGVQDMRVKGDTLEYNADAYKTNPDATSEDLVKKLPGMTSNGNTIQHNGEDVKKVLVDGKPFFNDDPTATLKNLPADMVSSVQVFDMQSDQAQFSGFMDGNESKTINLVTKKGVNVGQFGNAYSGIGLNGRFNAGGTFNHFNGGQRISVIGMVNNVNQQNFNTSDIMSVLSNSATQGGPPRPGSGGANFFSDQQSGFTTTHSFGVNYSDYWGKKLSVTGSYFFNRTDNTSNSSVSRNYFIANRQTYNEVSQKEVVNANHRLNLKLEYVIDSMNKLTVTPALTVQNVKNTSVLDASTLLPESAVYLSRTASNAAYSALGYRFSNDILFQHKFERKGRTFSTAVNTTIDRLNGNGDYSSKTFYGDTLAGEVLDQEYTKKGKGNNISANLSYTEPLGKGQLLVSYRPGFSFRQSEKTTENLLTGSIDNSLSNSFNYSYHVQGSNISYRLTGKTGYFIIGSDFQTASLKIDQQLPASQTVNRTFFNMLPSAVFNKNLKSSANAFVRLTTTLNAPPVEKMQNVIDLANPLLVQMGNSELDPSYETKLTARLMKRQPEKERHMFLVLNAKYTNQFVTNQTRFIEKDTTVSGVRLNAGSQLSQPVNMDGYKLLSLFGVYGFQVKKIKGNLSFNGGYSVTHTPSKMNEQVNFALNNSLRAGTYFSSNISPALDFSLSYTGILNSVTNTLQSGSTYFNSVAALNLNYMPVQSLVLATDFTHNAYKGLSQGFDQSYIRWNASVGYKFLKSKNLEVRLSVYDILNQNTNLNRTITETYTEDNYTQALKRYGLLTLTYKFRHFKAGSSAQPEMQVPKGMPPPGSLPAPPQ